VTSQSGVHSSRILELDGLRAIAILMVMLDHFTPWAFRGNGPLDSFMNRVAAYGGSGVDLFFVLSGFLITGILVDSKGTENYFARFFWRRSLRIFPAFYAFMIPVSLAMPWLFTTGIGRGWFLLYLRNWRGPDAASDTTLGHLWSLAVEEQFYCIWALVVFFCSRKLLWRVCLFLIAAAPLIRTAFHYLHVSGYMIFRVTPARMDSLLMGALVALAFRRGMDVVPYARIGLVCGLTALLVLRTNINSLPTQMFWPSASPLFFASCLVLAVTGGSKLLRSPVLARISKYSYAMYLFHLLVGWWIFHWCSAIGLPPRTVAIPVAALGVFGMAALSWKIIEAPALRLKDRYFTETPLRDTPVLAEAR